MSVLLYSVVSKKPRTNGAYQYYSVHNKSLYLTESIDFVNKLGSQAILCVKYVNRSDACLQRWSIVNDFQIKKQFVLYEPAQDISTYQRDFVLQKVVVEPNGIRFHYPTFTTLEYHKVKHAELTVSNYDIELIMRDVIIKEKDTFSTVLRPYLKIYYDTTPDFGSIAIYKHVDSDGKHFYWPSYRRTKTDRPPAKKLHGGKLVNLVNVTYGESLSAIAS